MKTVVVFDQKVTKNSPAGSCVREEILALTRSVKVVLFTSECDLSVDGLSIVRVPLPSKPILLRYVLFQFLARVYFFKWRLANRVPDAIQCTQGQFVGADICYPHFCHSRYLSHSWAKQTASGLRRVARYSLHRFNAFFEARSFATAKLIVCPSRGLHEELRSTFPEFADKLRVIENPIDLVQFSAPADSEFALRKKAASEDTPIQLCFVALGDFERKGLGILLSAIAKIEASARPALHVVGGSVAEIQEFANLANRLGVAGSVRFHGLQTDIRPYLWNSDVFVLLSTYEVFPLVVLQAAAAGLPILSTRVSGVEEILRHNQNGWLTEREPDAVAQFLLEMRRQRSELWQLGRQAQADVRKYEKAEFHRKWTDVYAELI